MPRSVPHQSANNALANNPHANGNNSTHRRLLTLLENKKTANSNETNTPGSDKSEIAKQAPGLPAKENETPHQQIADDNFPHADYLQLHEGTPLVALSNDPQMLLLTQMSKDDDSSPLALYLTLMLLVLAAATYVAVIRMRRHREYQPIPQNDEHESSANLEDGDSPRLGRP